MSEPVRDYTTVEEYAALAQMYAPSPQEVEMQKTAGKPRSPQWPSVRRKWLDSHTRCESCGGKDALEVHHLAPFHLHPELELEPTNFRTLCEKPGHVCHYTWGHFGVSWQVFNPDCIADTQWWANHRQGGSA